MTAALEVEIRRKDHGLADCARAVLRDVCFSLRGSEIVALFGASGSGKSTMLRIAVGLDRLFAGHVARGPGALGVVFQEPRLLPWLTVADNIRLVRHAGAPLPDVDTLLCDVGLSGTAQQRPAALSLGMARRAALARALAVDPALLVLDEPFASLDPMLAGRISALLVRRASAGASVLFATHELDQALSCADRILVLTGSPATLAADVALPRMNVGARDDVRANLLARFPFLSAEPAA